MEWPLPMCRRLIRLDRQEHGWQRVVAVAGGFRRHRDEKRVREGRFGDHCQIDAGGGDRIAGEEAFGELAPNRGGVALAERGFRDIEPSRIDVVFHVPLLQIHLNRRVAQLVDHLHREAGAQLFAGRQAADHRHGARG